MFQGRKIIKLLLLISYIAFFMFGCTVTFSNYHFNGKTDYDPITEDDEKVDTNVDAKIPLLTVYI